jgi:precorrin-6Y C5,15-methyltransferase (decarboxylating)
VTGRWLTVVGIGEDGLAGLGPAGRRALDEATLIVGGRRHLALVEELARPALAWRSPLAASLDDLQARRGQPTVVLASGDPLWFGVGRLLAERFGTAAIRFLPQLSAFALAAARLGWAIEATVCTTVHGRPLDGLRRHLAPGRRLLVLAEDRGSPAAVAALLVEAGYGASPVTVLEHLAGGDERMVAGTAAALPGAPFADLAVIAVELRGGSGARPLPLLAGLPDDAYRHDGQLTKAEARALALARLAPLPGQLLWDVGAGAGSIGIEWLRAAPGGRAIAVERDAARARLIRANARQLGVPELELIEGEAPACLAPLPAPDAVFVGGGGRDPALTRLCLDRLRPGGRLVMHAVTIEGERALLALHEEVGGDLARLQLSRAAPVGGLLGWRPAMPVTQLVVTKPCAPAG